MKHLAALFALVFAFQIHTIANPDIWYHLALGQRLLGSGTFHPVDPLTGATGHFVNFYWLFEILVASVMKSMGTAGVTLLFFLPWLGVFYFAAKSAGMKITSNASGVFLLVAILLCQSRFQERPEVFSYLFIVIDIYLLSRWKAPYSLSFWRGFAVMAFIQMLWCNMHGFFVLGPALAGAKVLSIIFESGEVKKNFKLLFLPVILAAASCVSPYGWNVFAGAYDQWNFLHDAAPVISEAFPTFDFLSTRWDVVLFFGAWMSVIGMATIKLNDFRKNFFALLLAATGLWLSASAARMMPLLPLFSAPLVATIDFEKFKLPQKLKLIGATAVSLAPLAFTVWILTQGFYQSLNQPVKFGFGVSETMFPSKFESFLSGKSFPADSRWFCDSTIGSYLEYHHPGAHLFADGRFDVANPREFIAASLNGSAFQQLNDREHFDYAVLDVGRSTPVVVSLLVDRRWRLVYRDLATAFFVRSDLNEPEFTNVAAQMYQGENLSDRMWGNDAIQWTVALASSDAIEALVDVLGQFSVSKVIPSPVLSTALTYLRLRPNGKLLNKILELRPKMLALDKSEAVKIDRQIESIQSGTFWQ